MIRRGMPSGRGKRKAGLPERPEKSVTGGREDLGSTENPEWGSYRAAAWPSDLTPAHEPRSPAFEARAGADMRWAASLEALSLAHC